MIVLGWVEGLQRNDAGDNRLRIDLLGLELAYVGFGDFLLPVAGVEDQRAVLRAVVGPLMVQLRGIVGNGKKDHEDSAIRNLRSVEDDPDGFGVAGGTGADLLVVRGISRAARVAGCGRDNAFDAGKNGLDTPKAAPSEDGSFPGLGGSQRRIKGGFGKGSPGIGAAVVGPGGGPDKNAEGRENQNGEKDSTHREHPAVENATPVYESLKRLDVVRLSCVSACN